MTVVEASIDIEAPAAEVWRIVADPRNLPRWDHRVTAVEGVPDEGLSVGTEYRVTMRFMGARVTVRARVLDLTPEKHARIRLSGSVDATVETWLEQLDPRRTRLRHRVEYRFRGGPLGNLAASAVKLFGAPILLRHGTEAQKRQVEASLR